MTIEEFRSLVGEAIGEASMCWSETPKGEFDSSRAALIVDRIINAYGRKAQLEFAIQGHMDAMKPLLEEWSKLK